MAALFRRKNHRSSSDKGHSGTKNSNGGQGSVNNTTSNTSDISNIIGDTGESKRVRSNEYSQRIIRNTKNNSNNNNNSHIAKINTTSEQTEQSPVHQKTPWIKKKLYNSPFPRFSHAASSITSDQGAIYLMGGLSSNAVYGDMWVIEPIKQRTTNNASSTSLSYIASPIENFERIPSPRTGHASVLVGNAFIVFGGDTVIDENDQYLDNRLYFFNISSLKWTITSPEGERPDGRYSHQISVLNFELNNKPGHWLSYLYVFGGQMDDQYFNDIWKFDLSNFRNPKTQWEKINCTGDIPPPLANHSMVAFNNKLYVYGGNNGSMVNDKMYCFNPLTNKWEILKLHGKFQPAGLSDHAVTLYQNLMFIYGGKMEDDSISNDFYAIDLNNLNSFKIKTDLAYSPGARCGHSMSVNSNEERLIIMGGDKYDNNFEGVDLHNDSIIDEGQLSYSSSVVFEFDIKKLDQFMERVSSNNTHPIITSTPLSSQSNLDLSDLPDTSNIEQKQAHRLSYLNTDDQQETTKDSKDRIKNLANDSQYMKNEESLLKEYEDTENGSKELIEDDTIRSTEEASASGNSNVFTNVSNSNKVEGAVNKSKTAHSAITNISGLSPEIEEEPYHQPSTPMMLVKGIQEQSQLLPFSPAYMDRDNEKLKRLIQIVGDVKEELNKKVLEANEKINSLTIERDELKNENAKFVKIEVLTELNEIIKGQQLKLKEFGKRLLDEEEYQEKIKYLESENDILKSKLDNIKLIKGENAFSVEQDDEEGEETNSITLLNLKIDNLVNEIHAKEGENEHLDKLKKLESDFNLKDIKLKEYENKQRETISSLNKTYKALHVSQNELNKYKEENNNLRSEIDKLKIAKRVYSNNSNRSSPVQGRIGDDEEIDEEAEEDDDEDPLLIKLKDLEAHLYIVSQERDELKEELLKVKKQLYNNRV